jgi:murein L,D-transpeptidase YafK
MLCPDLCPPLLRLPRLMKKICRGSAQILLLTVVATLPLSSLAKSLPDQEPSLDQALPNPDFLLIEVYKNLAANNLQQAQIKIDELVLAYPNFQLGHLIRGDLLLMHTSPVTSFGAAKNATPEKLKAFREEAIARLRAIREKPDPDLIPRSIIQLRDDQKKVVVIDAKRSRLYIYDNNAGQLKLFSDFYISQGKFGIDKLKEGDQKTPTGVYYITSHLPGAKLPDFYGPGALPINYPNDWDKLNGRSGSGIWLHGVPSENFSRPPLASDGCVVLTNPDFLKIAALVDIGKTPVIISEQIEFVNSVKWKSDKIIASKMLEEWRVDQESLSTNRVLANYSRYFKTLQGEDLATWVAKQHLTLQGSSIISVKLRDITQFRYPGKNDMIVTTFTQDTVSGKNKSSIRKRQYWIKEAAKWRIIYETFV